VTSLFADIIPSQAVWTIAYITVLLGLSIYGLHRYSIIHLFLKNRHAADLPPRYFEELPVVTVQLPIFNEYHVVQRLLDAVAAVDYPRDRLEIQVLDDSTDETFALCRDKVAALKASGLDIVHIHRTNRAGYKAGALENGLHSARGEFVFILDADFVPQPDILLQLVHHFTDEKTGMVQARWGHLNAGASLLTRLQAMFLDGHLLLEQTARARSGRFFNFNGTAGMWRRRCIEDAGGWEHDTLTEDLDLSYRAQLRGWRFVFLPDVVVPAELPEDIDGFKSQQHRWTKGSIQTCLKILPAVWRSRIPLTLKTEATIHLTSNFGYLLLILLCLLTLPHSRTEASFWRTLLVDIPIFLATTVSIFIFYAVALRHAHPKTWMQKITLLPGLIALGIGMSVNNARGVLEALFRKQSEFTRTPKRGNPAGQLTRYVPTRTWVPLLEVFFALYFLVCLVDACLGGRWTSLPFLALFVIGFSYVALLSFGARWSSPGFWSSESMSVAGGLQKTGAALALASTLLLGGCASGSRNQMIISTADQKMVLLRDGKPTRSFPVSTSKFGLGDSRGSYATPLGKLRVRKKIGDDMPAGTVFKGRIPTGEVLPVNAPGRDPIVTRILWLEGLEARNRNAFSRYIYIHGTPEERNIGQPVSFGCIRMRSCDVIELFDSIGVNAQVFVTPKPLPRELAQISENQMGPASQGDHRRL